ncbi:ABC transporter permease [Rhodovibrio salinarum]|uniref:ABC transporter permease n=1 Tax=Rhodovibrio salinarum TaxID=1087 RepID=A0A934QLJ1_9PROT|nr:ABC transporter permease [Rhodovibrio salinarum]MBK1699126.1 ABC transporter permease [Rhodovibrio salinarum]
MAARTFRPVDDARFLWARNQPTIVAFLAFLTIFVVLRAVSAGPMSYFEFSFLASGGATLALAAIGETIVILVGGFDLSAGAVISLVNVLLATHMGDSLGSQVLWCVIALAAGGAVGAVNGFFAGFMRLPAIVVTLATMFIVQGITLLVLDQPGGSVPYGFVTALSGSAIPGVLPMPVVLVALGVAAWLLLRNSRLGTGLYAVGSDPDAAQANGISIARSRFRAFFVAGLFYAAAGIFTTAQTGAGDPLIGQPLLLQIFAAVVLGGTRLGGGRGGCVGTVFGAYTLMMTVNILLVLNVSAYYSTIAEGAILILAVLGSSLGRGSALSSYLRFAGRRLGALRQGTRPQQQARHAGFGKLPAVRADDGLSGRPLHDWIARHKATLRFVVPSYVALALVLAAAAILAGAPIGSLNYINSLLVLTTFLAILGLGQGTVVLTGGLDLSIPWTLTFCGVLLTGLAGGSDVAASWAIPLVLAVGTLIGLANGLGVVFLGLSPIVVTLAMNGIVQGLSLVYTDGTPKGWAPPALQEFMTGNLFGFAPVVYALVAFVIVATLLLTRTTFGRRVFAVGNSQRVARLSGVGVGATLLSVYMLSGFCSGLAGVLLTGFNGQAFNGMGDSYLLPSIAVVVVGGTLITGGRGHYLGIFGGALVLTALATALTGTMLPDAVRSIIYGLVVLGAILALRERTA